MGRGYQYNFSDKNDAMYQVKLRQKKANTMVKVISDFAGAEKLATLKLLNVGGSAGIIDEFLSNHFKHVTGVDIDEKAIEHAKKNHKKNNLHFELADAMNLPYENETFDVVVCSQVYEHVLDSKVMMREIYRVLKTGGIVYFAAGNRLMFNEPHYNLPLLSVMPRFMAHGYMRIMGKGKYYYEKHLTYWGLKRLVKPFEIHDYTRPLINQSEKYGTAYMMVPESKKQKIASFIGKYFYWLVPGYVWVLKK